MKNFTEINRASTRAKKKSNLIERLWNDSHEKQTPQRFGRYAVMLIMLLTLGVGQMWAKTVYMVANVWNDDSDAEFWVHAWNGTNSDEEDVKMELMDNESEIYYAEVNGSNNKFIFIRRDKNGDRSNLPWSGEWNRATFEEGTDHNCFNVKGWDSYEMIHDLTQETVYFTSSADNVYVNVNRRGDGDFWNLVTMSSVGKTYNGTAIYTGTFNVVYGGLGRLQFKEVTGGSDTWTHIIGTGDANSWTADLSSYLGKLYDGSSWHTYGYDVTLNRQGGTTGSTTIIGTVGSAMPSATMPGKAGYSFNGYFTGTSGSGSRYYNADGTSAHTFANNDPTTLYACWTAAITPSAKYTNDGSSYTTGTTGGTVTINGNSSATDVLEGATYSIVATPAEGYMVESVDVGSTNIYSNTTRATGTYNNSTQTADAAATVTVKFAMVKNITVYVYVGDKNTGDVTAASVEMNGCTPYVGGTACSAQNVNVYTGSAPKFTLTGNWLTYTFTNVTKVTSITCARTGGNIFTGAITADKYIMYDGTDLTGQCIPYVASWSTAPANGAVGGNMTAAVNTTGLTSPSVSWSSSNTDVATVNSSTGYIQYVTTGSARITASISWSAGNDYCAGSTTKYEDITVTSGATVSATRTCPAYVAAGVAGQVTLDISSTGATTGWYYRIYNGSGYEGPDNVNASSNSASWTMTGGINTGANSYVVILYNGSGVEQARSSSVSVTGETAFSTTIAAGSNGSVSPSGTVYANNSNLHPSITATPNTNYHFVDWTSNNITASVASTTSATTTVTATEAGHTITANFAGDQYTITYKDQGNVAFSGSHVESPSAHPTTHTYGTATSLNSATKTGYTFGGWFTTSNCASGTDVTSLGATAYTDNITLYAKWTEIMSDLSTSCSYDVGDPSYSAPTVSGSATDVGYTTTRTITATAAGTGYTFVGWTLTNCTRTDGGGATTNPITIRSNGDGAAASVVANYEEDLSTNWKVKGSTAFGDYWVTDHWLTKKSGHSTEDVGYYTVTLSSTNNGGGNTDFNFKVVNHPSNTWYTLTTDGSSDWYYYRDFGARTMGISNNESENINICADIAGNYEIKVDYSTPASPTVTITFPTTYTLTYAIGSVAGTDGSITSSPSTSSGSKVVSGNTVTLTAPSEKTGYTWKGWYLNSDGSGVQQCATKAYAVTMDADKTLYACYTEDKYTVAFNNGDHGTVSPSGDQQVGIEGKSITATPATGWKFVDWSKTGTNVSLSSTTTNPTTVTASGTGSVTPNYAHRFILRGSTVASDVTTAGMAGWSATDNSSYASATIAAGVMTITANLTSAGTQYKFNVYDLVDEEYHGQTGTGEMGDGDTWTLDGTNDVKFTTTIAGTYTFTYNCSTGSMTITYPTTYTLTYSIGSVAGTDGSISTSPTTASGSHIASGSDITLTGPAAKTGYHWKGWYTNAGGTTGHIEDEAQAISVKMNADMTLYACYEENTFDVSASASPAAGGTVSPTVATSMGQVTGGSINASANPGYSFTSWSIATGSGTFTSSTNTASNTFQPTAASTLTGTFSEIMRTVSVDVNNEYLGSVSTTSLTNVGPETKSAAVTATPASGATFTRWDVVSGVTIASDYTSASNPVKVNATAASKTLTAVFTETTYTVSMNSEDNDKGTVADASKSVGQITAVAISATPKSGYMFSKWVKTGAETVTYYTGPGNGQLTDASGEEKETTYICVTGNVTLQATWEPDRSSGYVVHYGNSGKNADGGTDASQTRAWKDGKLYRPTIEEGNISSFTFTAGVADVDKVIEFKVHKLADDSWYGYNSAEGGKITGSIANATLSTDYGNGRICIIMPGSYTFTWNKSNNQLSISYPTDVYYVRGGFDSWRWSYPMTETSSGIYEATVNMTEANHTYSGDNGVTLLIGGQYYGKNTTTITRESNVANSCVIGQSNIGLTTDFTGNYTFTFNSSTNQLTVTYPTAYKLNYAIGTVNGTDGSITTSPETASGSWVLEDDVVTLTGPAAKEGYTWSGWYTNAAGSTGKIDDTNRAINVTMNATKTLYACYTLNNHDISYTAPSHGSYTIKVGSLDPVSANTSADYAQTIELAASAATGYHFTTWSVAKSASGTVTPSPDATTTPATFSMPDDDITVSATFAANNYTITLNNHEATTTGTTSVSVTFDANTGLTSDITVPEKDGYTFGGYYTAEGGSGTQLINASGAWQTGNTWINAGGNWVNDDALELHAKWTANNYTVTFDAATNSGTCGTDEKEVTFGSAYGELPTAVHSGDDTFLGWYTTPSGEGSLVTAETLVSIAADHTLYARFETTFEVVVQFKCGSDVLYPATKVYASASSSTAISAPEILGYAFSSWSETGGSSVSFDNTGAASTTINTTAAATIVANYTVVPTVYFKNNLGWDNVYVTFDAYFDDSKESAPGNSGRPYYKMTQLGSTDIFYYAIPNDYVASNYASWAYNIAFDNTGFNYSTAEADPNHHGNYEAFNGGEFIGRGDFDPKATMFIPYNGDTEARNGGTFFRTGCWMKYNSTESGYMVHVNTYRVGSGGSAVTGTPIMLTSDVAGGFEFKAKVTLGTSNYTYGFMLHKEYQKNDHDLWYTNTATINSGTDDLPWHFYTDGASENGTRCGLLTEATGDYEFIVSFGTGRPMVNVEYPVSVGDYRLVYKDLATWSNGAHDANWNHPSRVIKAKANAEDIVSFYISYDSSPSILLQKCTSIDGSGNPVWNAGSAVTLGATAKGIYNYKVTQDADKNATATFDGDYAGNYYIRTDVSDGGWSNYKTSGTNGMTYSEYAETEHNYTHYYMRFVNQGKNIKFCIANDYSECISDTLVSDTYTNEWIEAYANVRFMWDKRTNKISRAYISGSTTVSDRFLVLEGSPKMFDKNGQALTTAGGGKVSGLNDYEMRFIDDQNWIYEADIQAQPGAKALLTAKYRDKIQYFGGSGPLITDSVLLINGSSTDKYPVRVVYDFKTNRLIKAFLPPDGDITTDLAIEADLMIIRDHQEDAKQITFDGGSLSEVKTVYGALMFNKYTVNNKERTGGHGLASLSKYERDLFYISFPFEVKLSEVFGFGTYGKHWILEYYDGKGRAKNGFWADSDPNWKFVMPKDRNDFTMKAFEGYILALDLDEMTESSEVWNNNVENVYLYFPSSADVEDIQATNRLIEIDQDGYECHIGPRFEGGDDRRLKDSYWHCIGVPSFANYSSDLHVTNGGTQIDWSDEDGVIDWSTPSLPYLYTINWNDKSLSVTRSATFTFKATWSYLVQYAGTSIYWSNVNVTPAAIVARERTAPTNTEFCIELQKAGEKADQTFVRLTNEENVTTGFDFNYDLSKEFNKSRSNIYTMVTTIMEDGPSVTEVAGNVLPMSEQTTVIPVGVKITSNGDYTFAIPEGTNGVGVTLIDNETGIRTSLSALDYTINLNAGTYNGRFALEISPIVQTPTDVEPTSDSSLKGRAHKIMIDGLLYIVKDGVIYDARGARVE